VETVAVALCSRLWGRFLPALSADRLRRCRLSVALFRAGESFSTGENPREPLRRDHPRSRQRPNRTPWKATPKAGAATRSSSHVSWCGRCLPLPIEYLQLTALRPGAFGLPVPTFFDAFHTKRAWLGRGGSFLSLLRESGSFYQIVRAQERILR
jgi:hypothetical protein